MRSAARPTLVLPLASWALPGRTRMLGPLGGVAAVLFRGGNGCVVRLFMCDERAGAELRHCLVLIDDPLQMIGVHHFAVEQLTRHLLEHRPPSRQNFKHALVAFVDNAANFEVDLADGIFAVDRIRGRIGIQKL